MLDGRQPIHLSTYRPTFDDLDDDSDNERPQLEEAPLCIEQYTVRLTVERVFVKQSFLDVLAMPCQERYRKPNPRSAEDEEGQEHEGEHVEQTDSTLKKRKGVGADDRHSVDSGSESSGQPSQKKTRL